MLVRRKFVEPRSGAALTITITTDSIVANVGIEDDKGVLVDVELSRASLVTLINMLQLTLFETPLDAVIKKDVE